jgi:hypothetical protein
VGRKFPPAFPGRSRHFSCSSACSTRFCIHTSESSLVPFQFHSLVGRRCYVMLKRQRGFRGHLDDHSTASAHQSLHVVKRLSSEPYNMYRSSGQMLFLECLASGANSRFLPFYRSHGRGDITKEASSLVSCDAANPLSLSSALTSSCCSEFRIMCS